MKRRTKKLLGTFLVIIIVGFVFIKSTNRLTVSGAEGNLKTFNDNEIILNVDGFNDYVNIGIKYSDSINIKTGLKFRIIDSKNNLVDEFKLEEDQVVKKSYDAKKGTWKIVVDFEGENQEAMIKFFYHINSTKDNDGKFI